MPISFNLAAPHRIAAANSHYYDKPTEPLYIDRTLQYHDLIYLCDGQWMITESGIDYQLEKDDILLLSAGHHHYTRLPCAPHTSTICIHVSCESGDLSPSAGNIILPTHFHIGGSSNVKKYFEKIVSTFWSDQTFKQERLSTLFNMLMIELLDVYENNVQQTSDMIDEIIALIHRTPHKRFTTKEIAERYSVSTKTIDAAMIRSTGLSFSKYQTSRKLEMVASQLAVEPDVKLSEIAATYAFYDEFHLSRSFKQKYGQSPSQYRTFLHEKDH